MGHENLPQSVFEEISAPRRFPVLASRFRLSPGSRPPSPEEIIKHQIDTWLPAYMKLERQHKLKERVEEAYAILENCELCPRKCGVNRRKGEKGFCQAPFQAVVFSAHPHFGEEKPLVGIGGSGTIFFSHCNLRCVFCQNWEISQEGKGMGEKR